MKRKAILKGFTLIEMLIVIVIVGILAVVLIESYLTISKTALRVEQEKNISEESLILTQVFQAISDEATIDYEKYGDSLNDSDGFTGTLYLTGGQWSGTSIYTVGENCLDLDKNFEPDDEGNITQLIQNYTGCYLVMKQGEDDGIETQITTPGKVIISKVMFKIIPYDSDTNYFSDGLYEVENGLIMNEVHQPGFWMFIHLYAPLYQPIGINKIDLPLQLFFNLNL